MGVWGEGWGTWPWGLGGSPVTATTSFSQGDRGEKGDRGDQVSWGGDMVPPVPLCCAPTGGMCGSLWGRRTPCGGQQWPYYNGSSPLCSAMSL